MKAVRLFGLLLAIVPSVSLAQGLDFPANAERTIATEDTPASYAIPVGPWDGVLPTHITEGTVSRQAWRVDAADLTTLQLLAPLREQLIAAGFEIVFECDAADCGGFDFRFATEVLPPPGMYVDLGDFRYLGARRGDEAMSLLVSRSTRAGFVQVIRVGEAGSEPVAEASAPAVRTEAPRNLTDFGTRLETEGRVVLSDLSFETGSAQLGQGSFPSLRALADYLNANPDRKVALVGHTDSQGSLDGNITLSRRRAGSVLERLVSDYGTRRAQLDAQGMGYLAPISTNLTDAGREANRRVEVIITSTQ